MIKVPKLEWAAASAKAFDALCGEQDEGLAHVGQEFDGWWWMLHMPADGHEQGIYGTKATRQSRARCRRPKSRWPPGQPS